MKGKGKNITGVSLRRLLSVMLMAFCLTFLTSVNYFLYPSQDVSADQVVTKNSNNFPPSGPTEEKSSSGAFSIIEEMLHEPDADLNFEVASSLLFHQGDDASRLLAFHGELISPPPEV